MPVVSRCRNCTTIVDTAMYVVPAMPSRAIITLHERGIDEKPRVNEETGGRRRGDQLGEL